jgi:hypothetical protein
MKLSNSLTVVTLALSASLLGCSNGSDNGFTAAPTMACGVAAAQALQTCIGAVNAAQGACYLSSDSACGDGDATVLDAQAALESAVQDSCADGAFMGMTAAAVVGRLQNACQSQSDSIAWRTFGGPQGAVWPQATDEQRDCLQTAHATVSQFFDAALAAANACVADDACDATAVTAAQREAAIAAADTIAQACPALADVIAVDPATYIERAEQQLDCTLAVAHADTAPLAPQCGPSNVDNVPARGEWTQIVLDRDKWGTMCGDGTDYAIQIRLAPEGYPLDRIVVALEGGGVCLFEDDCRRRKASSPGLFNAQDGLPLGGGIASDSSPDNPFANWTKVYLPYCNQDVFTGGGVLEQFSDFNVPRFGAVNLRAGMQVARDILWQQLDAQGGDGFRPDQLIALFGGFSAGGYGTIYNYHWVLDDLQWPRTAAFPDAGGALDNGSVVGVRGLGDIKIPAWGTKPYLPPYCFSGRCAVGTEIYREISPRLKQVPEQQMLILSNQKDNTQQGDAFFTDEAHWIDTMRAAYCDTKDLPGIQWYLTSDSLHSVHVVSPRDEFYYGEVAGFRMVDWFWQAVTDPDAVSDWAEEGNFTTDIPGSHPFPCALPM